MQQKAGVCLHNTMQHTASGAKLELNVLAPETQTTGVISSVLPSPAKDHANEPPCPRTPCRYFCRVLSSLPWAQPGVFCPCGCTRGSQAIASHDTPPHQAALLPGVAPWGPQVSAITKSLSQANVQVRKAARAAPGARAGALSGRVGHAWSSPALGRASTAP